VQYKEAASSLEASLERVKELEAQIEATKASLVSTEAERDEKQQTLEALQATKVSLETELTAVQDSLEDQRKAGEAQLFKAKDEVTFSTSRSSSL
jgi:chromosome segregation ATPase